MTVPGPTRVSSTLSIAVVIAFSWESAVARLQGAAAIISGFKGGKPCASAIPISGSGSTVLCALKYENHLRQASDRAAQNIQAGEYGLKERHQRMINRWPLARYFHQAKQPQFIQSRYCPKRRALRICKRFNLQPLILGHARKTVSIEQHKMARRMVAAPGAMPEDPGIQGVVVGRLDQNQAPRREQRPRFGQHLIGAPDVLDQIEHEDEVVFFRTVELLDGAEEVTMAGTLRGSLGAGIDIDDLRCRPPR